MRTTLTLDTDVALRIKEDAVRLGKPVRHLVNEALREGLSVLGTRSREVRPYQTQPKPLGLRAGLSYDSTSDLLASAEGEDFS